MTLSSWQVTFTESAFGWVWTAISKDGETISSGGVGSPSLEIAEVDALAALERADSRPSMSGEQLARKINERKPKPAAKSKSKPRAKAPVKPPNKKGAK